MDETNINKGIKNEEINELLKKNNHKNFLIKRCSNCFQNEIIFNKNNLRNSLIYSTNDMYERFEEGENRKELSDKYIKIIKSQNKLISTRKINKESFGKGIFKIIKEQRGKRKFKFKIIGTLKTEPNYN